MASLQQRRSHTLAYFDQFDYPLTTSELNYWLHSPNFVDKKPIVYSQKHWCISGRQKNIQTRAAKIIYSEQKWQLAKNYAQSLSSIPFIAAIFVTGALAMNNCPETDDIDIMIICHPHTLWLTRLLVFFTLKQNRRPAYLSEHSSYRVKDKICDNLYLETTHLYIKSQSLYTAHEVLQSRCIFDRNDISQAFIQNNSWVKNYLPQAFKKSYKIKYSYPKIFTPSISIKILNFLVFKIQYLYMRSKITNESISLHQAFFHPRKYA